MLLHHYDLTMKGLLDITVSYINPVGKAEKKSIKDLLQQAQYTVLYFYPKDNTPGCTIEAREFTMHKDALMKAWAQIIWVSKDTWPSHCRFQESEALTIGLISDTKKILQAMFGAEGKKKFMGKEYMWTLRNTYLLDNQGTVLYKWENVNELWHAKEVLEYMKQMKHA